MKKHAILAIFLLFLTHCTAQSPVLDIYTENEDGFNVKGAYYKDKKNLLNGYEGTYVYTNGTTSLKIKLQKNIMTSRNGVFYEDLIVGEYQYIENGVEKVNTLSKLTPKSNNNNISGWRILTGNTLGCTDCTPTEKRLRLGFIDADSPNVGEIDIRKTTINGKDAILVKIFGTGIIAIKEGDAPRKAPTIKQGRYTMIKQ